MKLISLPDLHNAGVRNLPLLAADLAQADVVILAGDLTNGDPVADAARVVEAVRAFNPSILAVPGNWDTAETDAYLSDLGVNLHRRHRVVDGIAFVGVGGALLSIGHSPTEFTESTFQSYLSEAVQGLDPRIPLVLVSHQPPFDTRVDGPANDLHQGSHSVRAFIEAARPLLCLTGHIHSAVGIDAIGPTRLINPGPLLQGGYAVVELSAAGIHSLEIRRCKPVDY